MKKNFTFSMVLMAVLTISSSCASIIHGSKQNVEFASRPTGARLFIDGKDMGTTPQNLNLSRRGNRERDADGKRSFAIKLEMEGYKPYETTLERKLDGWIFGNLLFGGVVGIVIDIASGAMYRLTPKRIDGDFFDGTSSASVTKNGIYIGVTMQPDPSWEKIGQMTKLGK